MNLTGSDFLKSVGAWLWICVACLGQDAQPKVDGWREAENHWQKIERELLTESGAKAHLGEWVRVSGKPISLGSPILVKLESGVTLELARVVQADREELATFKKNPSIVTVLGPILKVDLKSRKVTIRAVDTRFAQ